MTSITRRQTLAGGAALAVMGASAPPVSAAETIVTTTYPGSWEVAHRQFLVPAFTNATGEKVALQVSLALDTIAKIVASRANPPFDAFILDEGPYLANVDNDIFAPLTQEKVPNLADLPQRFVDPNGKGAFVSAQILGIVYNPENIKTPPQSWNDLWKPEYKGRVGITGMGSSLGTSWMVEIAKLHGGDERNMEPAFNAVKELLPNLGAIAPNPGALATLFQQGQIDISFNYLNAILPLAEKGVPIAISQPETGWVLIRNTMHVVKNAKHFDLACRWVDLALSEEVQKGMAGPPNYLAPTNRKVAFGTELKKVAADNEALSKLTSTDWAAVNPQRSALIERFNKEVRI
jgi:putative spermidine/putrescine transport system substrate-binding protein